MKTKLKLLAIACGIAVTLVCTTQTSDAISTKRATRPMTDLQLKQISTTRLDTLGKCDGNIGTCFLRGNETYIGTWIEFVH